MNHPTDSEHADPDSGSVLTAPTPAETPWERWTATRSRRLTVAGGLLFALVLVLGSVIQPPKVIITPGDAEPTADAITIEGPPTYASPGAVYFLTVFLTSRRPTLFELAAAQFDEDAVVVDEREVYGTFTKRESDEIDRLLMSEAQASAKKSALERLGYTVTETGAGAFVRNVVPGAPADGRLQRGDVITAVNGTSVATSDAMADIIRAQAPGSTVVFTVERNDQVSTIEVPTVANEAGTTVVGIVTLTADPGYDYPFDVEITSGDVSGPSAGLAFSLGIIDELTPGDLTGGMRVAVTGTIDGEGRVGPIGSAREKAITAKQGRAQLMLVPVENLEDARSAGVDIEIVPVATLDDALAALAARGGAPVPNP